MRSGLARMLATVRSASTSSGGIGRAHVEGDGIGRGIIASGLERERVDVDAHRARGPELHRGDGEDARAAAVVEDGLAAAHLALEPGEHEPRRRVAAGAEGRARVEHDVHRARVGRLVPGGHDPQRARPRGSARTGAASRAPSRCPRAGRAPAARAARSRPRRARAARSGARRRRPAGSSATSRQRGHTPGVGAGLGEDRALARGAGVGVGELGGDARPRPPAPRRARPRRSPGTTTLKRRQAIGPRASGFRLDLT